MNVKYLHQSILFLTFLLMVSNSSALTMLRNLTPKDAQKLGVSVEVKKYQNNNYGVKIKIPKDGVFKDFIRSEYRILSGKDYQFAAPLSHRNEREFHIVAFSGKREILDQSELWLYLNDIPLGGSAYMLKLKDMLPPTNTEGESLLD